MSKTESNESPDGAPQPTGAMKVGDLLRCSKPMLFEDGFEGYEYSSAGTYFFARYRGHYFAMTAKHCLRNRSKDTIRLVFDELSTTEKTFVPLKKLHLVGDPPEGPQDWSDIAVIECDADGLTETQKSSRWFLDFEALMGRDVGFAPKEYLATRGFPTELGEIDYDRSTIVTQGFAVDGTYGGPTPEYAHMHLFYFSDLTLIKDPNGLSGSPVFLFRRFPHGLDYQFAGMILRAGKTAPFCRFLDCCPLFLAVQKIFPG